MGPPGEQAQLRQRLQGDLFIWLVDGTCGAISNGQRAATAKGRSSVVRTVPVVGPFREARESQSRARWRWDRSPRRRRPISCDFALSWPRFAWRCESKTAVADLGCRWRQPFVHLGLAFQQSKQLPSGTDQILLGERSVDALLKVSRHLQFAHRTSNPYAHGKLCEQSVSGRAIRGEEVPPTGVPLSNRVPATSRVSAVSAELYATPHFRQL